MQFLNPNTRRAMVREKINIYHTVNILLKKSLNCWSTGLICTVMFVLTLIISI